MKPRTLAFAPLALALTHITTIHGNDPTTPPPPPARSLRKESRQESLTANYRNKIKQQEQLLQELSPPLRKQRQSSFCSCSPRSFAITLDLSNTCNIDTVKPNSGIAFTICDVEVFDNLGNLIPSGDTIPTVITSVTLIEINSVGKVINVDDQYTNVNFVTGSSFDLTSISSSLSTNLAIGLQLNYVPTTAVLFMIGQNANEEEEVIATFVWIYSNSCDGVTLNEGDEYSWNVWSGVEEQLSDFCPANASSEPSGQPTSSGQPSSSGRPSSQPSGGQPSRQPSEIPSLEPRVLNPRAFRVVCHFLDPRVFQVVSLPLNPPASRAPNHPGCLQVNPVRFLVVSHRFSPRAQLLNRALFRAVNARLSLSIVIVHCQYSV